MPMCGGFSEARVPTAEEKELVTSLKAAVEENTGAKYATFEVVSITSQVVAGTNYYAKVNVGDSHIHVKLHKPLPCNDGPLQLMTVDTGKDAGSSLP